MFKYVTTKSVGLLALAAYILYRSHRQIPTAAGNKSLLWELTGPQLHTPSYLFGTMHLMCADDAILRNNVMRCLRRVESVYLEVAMDASGELLGGTVDFTIDENTQLANHVSESDYALIKSFFNVHQPAFPFTTLERYHPLMLTAMLYESFLPCERKSGTEIKIVEQAISLNKTVNGLESLAFQRQVFHLIPYEQQASELVKTIKDLDRFKQSMHELLQAYKQQDITALHDLTMQEESGVASHLDVLLYNRNGDWVQKIEQIVAREPTFFAVGAGHLGGSKGLLALLKAQGISARPLVNT